MSYPDRSLPTFLSCDVYMCHLVEFCWCRNVMLATIFTACVLADAGRHGSVVHRSVEVKVPEVMRPDNCFQRHAQLSWVSGLQQ